ncbi:hypothetical protein SDC9_79069 [bioreactor metagenome]|uniref:Uncharacterized protein n=1 Tax=bioreactor metagenome TaxID=1076179 RepID=A0A644YVE1_9ZZZZ
MGVVIPQHGWLLLRRCPHTRIYPGHSSIFLHLNGLGINGGILLIEIRKLVVAGDFRNGQQIFYAINLCTGNPNDIAAGFYILKPIFAVSVCHGGLPGVFPVIRQIQADRIAGQGFFLFLTDAVAAMYAAVRIIKHIQPKRPADAVFIDARQVCGCCRVALRFRIFHLGRGLILSRSLTLSRSFILGRYFSLRRGFILCRDFPFGSTRFIFRYDC